jgi:transcriptional regulator with XRE-family HTH domain
LSIGANVRRVREERGLSQTEVARRCGVAQPSIWGLERGEFNPSAPLLLKLSKALDTSTDELLKEHPKASVSPDVGLPDLLERALDAARRDAQTMARAINRLKASEGTLESTHISEFEEDKIFLEFREAGFSDEQYHEFILPLVDLVVAQEQEISRLKKLVQETQAPSSASEAERAKPEVKHPSASST